MYRKKNSEKSTVFLNISFHPKTIEILIEVKTNFVYSLPYSNSSNITNSIRKNTHLSNFIFVCSFFCFLFFSFFFFLFPFLFLKNYEDVLEIKRESIFTRHNIQGHCTRIKMNEEKQKYSSR